MFMPIIVAGALANALKQHEEREKCIAALPKEEQDAIRDADRLRFEKEDAHKKALEIANAGRARNFWGN